MNAHEKLVWSTEALIEVVMSYITHGDCVVDSEAFEIVKEAESALAIAKAEGRLG